MKMRNVSFRCGAISFECRAYNIGINCASQHIKNLGVVSNSACILYNLWCETLFLNRNEAFGALNQNGLIQILPIKCALSSKSQTETRRHRSMTSGFWLEIL